MFLFLTLFKNLVVNIDIQFKDNTQNSLSHFKASAAAAPMIVVFPAMGVRASFYKHLGAHFASIGFHCVTVDWRGFGASSVEISRKQNHGYKELIDDMHQVFEHLNARFPQSKKYLLGHSLGGQIGACFAARYPAILDGLILVASCLVYYKAWGKAGNQVRLAGNLFPLLANVFGYFPGHRLGFAGKEAIGVMKDWSYNARTGQYAPIGDNFDYETAFKQLNLTVLAITLEEDKLAIKPACEALYGKFSNDCPVQHIHVTKDQTDLRPLNHFKWAKEPKTVGQIVKDWMEI